MRVTDAVERFPDLRCREADEMSNGCDGPASRDPGELISSARAPAVAVSS